MCAIQVSELCKINKSGPKAHSQLHVNKPPQTQGGCDTYLRLSTKARKRPLRCELVKIYAS